MLDWQNCFLCDGYGRLDIGENYNKFFANKNLKCPLCDGKGRQALRSYRDNPWNKKREDYL